MRQHIRKRRSVNVSVSSRRELTRQKLVSKANECPGVKEAMEVFNASKPVQMVIMVPNMTIISAASHTHQ